MVTNDIILQKYDEKVDLWSIGALLYKVIVGQCGFYAVSIYVYVLSLVSTKHSTRFVVKNFVICFFYIST